MCLGFKIYHLETALLLSEVLLRNTSFQISFLLRFTSGVGVKP